MLRKRRECTVRNPNELTTLDMLNLFGVFLQVMNYESDLSQASNADIAKHLQEQDRKYLDKIIKPKQNYKHVGRIHSYKVVLRIDKESDSAPYFLKGEILCLML